MNRKLFIDAICIISSGTNCIKEVNKVVLEAKATITGNKKGTRLRIYIPTAISMDSAFPFKKGDTVLIKIDKNEGVLKIEKCKPERSKE